MVWWSSAARQLGENSIIVLHLWADIISKNKNGIKCSLSCKLCLKINSQNPKNSCPTTNQYPKKHYYKIIYIYIYMYVCVCVCNRQKHNCSHTRRLASYNVKNNNHKSNTHRSTPFVSLPTRSGRQPFHGLARELVRGALQSRLQTPRESRRPPPVRIACLSCIRRWQPW